MYKLFTKEWLGDLFATILLIIGFLFGISIFHEISTTKSLVLAIIFLPIIGFFITRPLLRSEPFLKPVDGFYALIFVLVLASLFFGVPYLINQIVGIIADSPIIFWALVLFGIAIFVIFIGSIYNNPRIFEQKQPSYCDNIPSDDSRYIPTSVKNEVWERDGGRCVICGSRRHLEWDHDIPVHLGGSNTANNIRVLCRHCNRKKSGNIE